MSVSTLFVEILVVINQQGTPPFPPPPYTRIQLNSKRCTHSRAAVRLLNGLIGYAGTYFIVRNRLSEYESSTLTEGLCIPLIVTDHSDDRDRFAYDYHASVDFLPRADTMGQPLFSDFAFAFRSDSPFRLSR